MPSIAVTGAKTTGHADFPPSTITASSSTVFINGKPIVLNGDAIAPHTNPSPSTHGGTVIASTSKIFVEGKAVGMVGDPISCSDTIASGSPSVFGS